ncbi:DUF1700 domain-containing protein [Parabacteroides sp. AF18-52]|jgi:hypothetical protein|uniref:HAAS signaling domain-containing protein n=1 Tax=Parabacteroides TaxID=375288 RepID=UPI000F0106EA|nr:DUF1700 domain-containing protein [Parabacteroides sp. AF18-52]RHR37567.1 DUF1700 domain-containing protein [Parabacteroides sp. AF18-52]
MKNIEFSDKNTTLLYDKYISEVKHMISTLRKEDQEDILMELNSHIYESIQHNTSGSETDKIAETLERLGEPRKTFAQLIADRKLQQATKTFNPLHVMKALSLNLSNGFIYILFSISYLFLFCFGFLIFAKLIFPRNTGLFIGEDDLFVGFIANMTDNSLSEVLGYWFIPIILLGMVIIYLFITLLLRLKCRLKLKK